MVMRSIQRQSEYVTLFAEVDTERLALLKKANSGTLTDKQIEKLQEQLKEIDKIN